MSEADATNANRAAFYDTRSLAKVWWTATIYFGTGVDHAMRCRVACKMPCFLIHAARSVQIVNIDINQQAPRPLAWRAARKRTGRLMMHQAEQEGACI